MNPERMFELMKKMLSSDEEDDHSTWVPVTKLRPEDHLRKIALYKDATDLAAEAGILIERLNLIKQKGLVMEKEWWDHLHRTYSLPREGNYTIEDDGTILMKPKKDKSDE